MAVLATSHGASRVRRSCNNRVVFKAPTTMDFTGGLTSNFTQRRRELAQAWVSWIWIFAILSVQIFVRPSWYGQFGLNSRPLQINQAWQILTHGLLHGGWCHAGMNAILILTLGSKVEWIMGRKVTLTAVLFGIFAGGISHLVLGAPQSTLVGASGGCMCLLLLLTTLSPQSRAFPLPVSGKNLGRGVLLTALGLALIDPALHFPGFNHLGRKIVDSGQGSLFQMGHACHFGGGVAGWLMGRWLLRPGVSKASLRKARNPL